MTENQENCVPTKIVIQGSEEIPNITPDELEHTLRNMKMAKW